MRVAYIFISLFVLLVPKISGNDEIYTNVSLLLSGEDYIKIVQVHEPGLSVRESIVVVSNQDATDVDFAYDEGIIFWAKSHRYVSNTIERVDLNDPDKHQKTIISHDVRGETSSLAVDWITRKLYWTDHAAKRIEVSDWDGINRKVLVWRHLEHPTSIVLDPQNGYMYWADWGDDTKIEKSSMDANTETRSVLIDDYIYWPRGLTIDYDESKLYWGDTKIGYIQSCDMDGRNRRTVLGEGLSLPYSLTMYGDFLYWLDGAQSSIIACDKNNGTDSIIIKKSTLGHDIKAYTRNRQPAGDNKCGANNGGCSHLCLLSSFDPYYTCACPTGILLLDDNQTCAEGGEKNLFFARRSDIRQISLDTPDYTVKVLPIDNVSHAIVLDYDSSSGFLYWSDDELHVIQRARLNGSEQAVVVTNVGASDGIAIDWIAKNLYWTDTATDRIEVSRLDGTSRKVIVYTELDNPRAICLDPEAGYMYWTDWSEKRPVIERAFLDGSQRDVIVSEKIGWPNGLALDLENRLVFWADAETDRIEVCAMDGSARRILVSENLHHIFGLTLLGDYIYWADWQERSIERMNRFTGKDRTAVVKSLPDMMGIKAVGSNQNTGTNTCAGGNNGNCSHLCLFRPPPLSRVCACPINFELMADNVTCVLVDSFLIFANNAGEIRRTSLNYRNSQQTPDVIISGLKKVNAIDFDTWDNRIYWTDKSGISRAFLDGTDTQEIVQSDRRSNIRDIAVDWLASNIYWTDSGKDCIEVARLDGSSRKALVSDNMRYPLGIVLDPAQGYMYWIRVGFLTVIERANLDGTNRHEIISDDVSGPSLAIDYKDKRIYWTDTGLYGIKSSKMDGSDIRNVLMSRKRIIICFSLYGEFVYWIDDRLQTIERGDKKLVENHVTIKDKVGNMRRMSIISHERQGRKDENACEKYNGGCQHLCLAHPKTNNSSLETHHCACPTHFTLNGDGQTCSGPKKYLLLSTRGALVRATFDSESRINSAAITDVVVPVAETKKPRMLAFDPVGESIYWADDSKQGIYVKSIHENGTEASKNIDFECKPFDMDLDPYSRTLYWTCSDNDGINFASIDTPDSRNGEIMFDKFRPRSIALWPEKGFIFYVNIAELPRIERALMDGESVVIIHEGYRRGDSLFVAVDKREHRLYWSTSKGGRIESSDIHGGNYILFKKDLREAPRGLAILGEFLYWFSKSAVSRIHKKSKEKAIFRIIGVFDIIAVEPGISTLWHPCSNKNGGCSHICFLGNDNKTQCSCPTSLTRIRDTQTCSGVNCNAYEFQCDNGQCIPLVWRCDLSKECDDGSDEMNCDECGSSEFKCVAGGCIEKEFVCDRLSHCKDGSDEKMCFSGTNSTVADVAVTTEHARAVNTIEDNGTVSISTTVITTEYNGTVDITKHFDENRSKISKADTIAIVVVAVFVLVSVILFLLWRHKTKGGRNGPNYEEVLTVRMKSTDQPDGSCPGEDDSRFQVRIARGKSLTSVTSSESELHLGPTISTSSERLIKQAE